MEAGFAAAAEPGAVVRVRLEIIRTESNMWRIVPEVRFKLAGYLRRFRGIFYFNTLIFQVFDCFL